MRYEVRDKQNKVVFSTSDYEEALCELKKYEKGYYIKDNLEKRAFLNKTPFEMVDLELETIWLFKRMSY